MTLSEFIRVTRSEKKYYIRPLLVCKDGFKMSVQGSEGHYCSPQENGTHFNKMEIGFPSEPEPLIKQYAENSDDYTNTVYGWVPVEIIEDTIDKHGGIDVIETFK